MFRDRIKAKYDELTPSFRRLADFILEQQLDATFMTATEMAHHMRVDAATVVRFAQTIGYSGFRELIKEVQSVVKAELVASYSIDLDDSDDLGLFRSLMENERHNIFLAQAQMTEDVDALLPALVDAQRIWVAGQGTCAPLANLCASSLREIGLWALASAPDPLDAAANLNEVGPTDLVIAFSLTGMDLGVANVVNFARNRGAKTVVFSASAVADVALAGEIVVVCPGPTQRHEPSFTSLAAMIVTLVSAFVVRYPEEALAKKEKLQESYRELLTLQAQSSSKVNIEALLQEF